MGERVRRVAGAVAVAFLAGCLPACLSPVPLDPTPQVDLDPRLVGTWQCLTREMGEGGDALHLTIARARERVYAIEMFEPGDDPDRYEAHGSLVDGRTVVNVRNISPAGGSKPWDFVEYAFLGPDVLEIRLGGFEGDDVELTPAALRARLAKPESFGDFCVCVRQKKKKE